MYEHHAGDKRQLFLGFALMVLGCLFLLDHLSVLSFSASVRTFWPLILIWIGLSRLLDQSGRPRSPRRIGDRQ
jgi:cell wall-active antibiotic response 4TMS protein YvqF